MRIRLPFIVVAYLLCSQLHADDPFTSNVATLFTQHCLRCHNDETSKGDFSLTSRVDVLDGGYVVAGSPDDSELLRLIRSDDAEERMPKDAGRLSEEDVSAIEQWIRAGAVWPAEHRLELPKIDRDWWSLKPIAVVEPPAGEAANPVDRFVDARLAEAKLEPVPQADPLTLIRRVTYDLTGLPPRPEEVDAFIEASEADSETAWSDTVDRLLASPAFGEKFGQHWLDIARYAETHGYDKDKPRTNAWPYRDYVIRSFNEDKPYGRFVAEQVAGDVLYPDEPDGVLGTGFLAAGPWDLIGHIEVGEGKLDGRIAKHLDRDEMISATFNVFQSTTVQCAQCHDHKFDPVSSESYYRLHAVFAAIDRADRVYAGLSLEQQREKDDIAKQLAAAKAERDAAQKKIDAVIAEHAGEWDRQISELKKSSAAVPLHPAYGYHSQIVSKPDVEKWVQVDLGQVYDLREVTIVPAYDNYNNIGAGFGFPVRFDVIASEHEDVGADSKAVLAYRGGPENALSPKWRPLRIGVEGVSARYVRVKATELAERSNDYILALGEIRVTSLEGGDENIAAGAQVSSLDSIESGERWGRKNLTDGIAYRPLVDEDASERLADLEAKRAEAIKDVVPEKLTAQVAEADDRIKALDGRLKSFPKGEVVYAAATQFSSQGQFKPTGGAARPIHFLPRGDLKSPGERMTPGGPQLWGSGPFEFAGETEGDARAKLAAYLVDRDNPLLWRSIVNRLVQWTLGQPLVSTPNDFGRMGGQPTHPELLDYLAAELRDDPRQSLKSIVRLLLTSEAYQRSSMTDEANGAVDTGNTLLWRFHRRRLTAEEFRDSILATAGVLRLEDRGGPSFQDFVIEKPQHSPHYEYHLHDPNDAKAFRRTIYRFVVRSQPQPMLTTLDCADPSISTPQRDESTTALQALTQWNHRLVEAMSGHLRNRLAGLSRPEAVGMACRLVWGREPDEAERQVLEPLLREHGPATLARVLFNSSAFTYVD